MRLTDLEHKYSVFIVCVIGIFIAVFDTSSSIVALPTIAQEFATDLPTAQWVIAGNSLTIAALLVPAGRLSDIVGRKRLYVIGALIFAIGALFASRSETVYGLIGARVVVGFGSAMTQATGMAILVASFEARERARMLGLQLGAVGLGSIAGPATGGLVVGTIGWRAMFAITAAATFAVAIVAQRTLRRRAKRPKSDQPPFDYAGALLFSTLLVTVLLALTLAPSKGWLAPTTLALCAASALLIAAFVQVERRVTAPMVDLALFRNTEFALGTFAALVVFLGISATRFLVPFFLQAVKGYPASTIGLLIVPAAVVTAVAAPFAGRLADRWGVRLFANIGMAITTVGFGVFGLLTVTTPIWAVVAGLMVMSLGMAVFTAANSASILNVVPTEAHGVTSGFVNLSRNSGNVIGVVFGTVVVTLTMTAAGHSPSLAAIDPGTDHRILEAFTAGVDLAATILMILAATVLALVVGWDWRTHRSSRLS